MPGFVDDDVAYAIWFASTPVDVQLHIVIVSQDPSSLSHSILEEPFITRILSCDMSIPIDVPSIALGQSLESLAYVLIIIGVLYVLAILQPLDFVLIYAETKLMGMV
jgi:hypothetical protein